jgi:hypothetical protein
MSEEGNTKDKTTELLIECCLLLKKFTQLSQIQIDFLKSQGIDVEV